ncbi:lipopolysaccharide biosynthesis protein [Coralliovum pocilloporae]|uniref:lipopolysaccharide biosynthesis protein n=1 Tax=Coralliovum pocilloporae TaxID=3066369 RepID=UPI00330789E6
MTERRRLTGLAGRFLSLSGGRVIGAGAVFLANLLIARTWSDETLGMFSVLMAISAILIQICSGGYHSIATVYTARYRANKQWGLLNGFIRQASKVRLIGTVLAAFISLVYLLWGMNAELTPTILSALMIAASVYIGTTLYFCSGVLVGYEQQERALLPETIIRPLFFLVSLGAFAALGLALSASLIFLLFTAINGLACLTIWHFFTRARPETRDDTSDKDQKSRWNKAATPWIITSLVWDFFVELHILAAGMIVAPAQIAILHVCFRFRILAGFGMRTIYMLMLPDVYAAHARKEPVGHKIRRMCLVGTAYALCVMAGFYVLGERMLSLFGPQFAQALDILLIMSGAILVRGLLGPVPALLSMYDQHLPQSIVMSACLVASLTAIPFAYDAMGIAGIAWCYVISNAVGTAILWLWLTCVVMRRPVDGQEPA